MSSCCSCLSSPQRKTARTDVGLGRGDHPRAAADLAELRDLRAVEEGVSNSTNLAQSDR